MGARITTGRAAIVRDKPQSICDGLLQKSQGENKANRAAAAIRS
jgi:hypothetical protein